MKKRYRILFMLLLSLLSMEGLQSCANVKAYQKRYLNDAEMELSARKSERFENSFQSYREGAEGANGGKTGGRCGCN